MSGTPLRQAVDQLLRQRFDSSLDYYLQTARANGKSWEQIARDINSQLDLSVSFATVRRWYPEVKAS